MKTPPQATDIEERVLGSLLTFTEDADQIFSTLTPSDFYRPSHRLIFETCFELYSRGSEYDFGAVSQTLSDKGEIEKAGGDNYMIDLLDQASSSTEYNVKVIKEKAIRRQLIMACSKIQDMSYDQSTETQSVIDEAQKEIFDMNMGTHSMVTLSEAVTKLFEQVCKVQEEGRPLGLRTGLDIDRTLQGFQDGKLYVIGARPSMGKTALVMTIMRRLAEDGEKSGIISLETSDKSLAGRLITQSAGISVDRFSSGRMSDEELQTFSEACGKLSKYGIYIDDQAAISAQQCRSKCRAMAQKGCSIIFVDFLQLLNAEGRSKHEEIGTITKVLKQTAKECDIPIVVLSQLSRKVEDRSDKRPQMADLRESGSIEEDADVICFLYRPEYYGVTTTKDGESTAGLAEVIIAKNKDGRTGVQRQLFIAEQMKFENFAFN